MIEAKYFDVIRKPVITEKSSNLVEYNKYVFKVLLSANKSVIKKAVESIFGVKVKSVNTVLIKGKVKKYRGKIGKRQDYKKAIVTLEEGQAIDMEIEVK